MPAKRIIDLPAPADFVRFKEGFAQRFVVTVDVEEEFDWGRPLSRSGHTLHSITRLGKFQEFCEGQGICPVYLVDYPIATSPSACDIMRRALASGRAEVGLQLHPWVNPPHDEDISAANSYLGNLPLALERAKFLELKHIVEQNLGVSPLIFRSGRYGAGANTAAIIAESGIAIDSSVRARFDYSAEGGPNFRQFPLRPWWIQSAGSGLVMELPLTTVYWGPLRQLGSWIYPRTWRVPRLRGALARMGLLERIPLTPEGVDVEEALRGIDIAIDDGLPVLVFSFHSPSLAPGFTPYVRDESDLDAFYDWWREVFAYLARRKVAPTSLTELIDAAVLA